MNYSDVVFLSKLFYCFSHLQLSLPSTNLLILSNLGTVKMNLVGIFMEVYILSLQEVNRETLFLMESAIQSGFAIRYVQKKTQCEKYKWIIAFP